MAPVPEHTTQYLTPRESAQNSTLGIQEADCSAGLEFHRAQQKFVRGVRQLYSPGMIPNGSAPPKKNYIWVKCGEGLSTGTLAAVLSTLSPESPTVSPHRTLVCSEPLSLYWSPG